MTSLDRAVVVGGGFFGCRLALFLKETLGAREVVVLEREKALLQRASFRNQARVHGGYHYPRAFTTARRSRVNLPRFCAEFPEAVDKRFVQLYAVARGQSKVNARQFERFCAAVGAPLKPAKADVQKLFNPRLIEAVYETEEFAFDAGALAAALETRLARAGVDVRLGAEAKAVMPRAEDDGHPMVCWREGGQDMALYADLVLVCVYAGLPRLRDLQLNAALKHEIAELALIEPPAALAGAGVTVMDGPFFSVMPFPGSGLHSLSHVRYTPHAAWTSLDDPGRDPYAALEAHPKASRADRMLRDAARYLPVLGESLQKGSHWEIKTVLLANEGDDGRPILFQHDRRDPRIIGVLGGKIDNIYDACEALSRFASPDAIFTSFLRQAPTPQSAGAALLERIFP